MRRNLNSSKLPQLTLTSSQTYQHSSNNDTSLLSLDMLLSEEEEKIQDEQVLNKPIVTQKPLIQTFSIEDLDASPIRVAGSGPCIGTSQNNEFEDEYKQLFYTKPIFLAKGNSNLQSPKDANISLLRNLQSSHGLLQTAEFKH